MSKLRGAVVGVGYLGTFHAQKYRANPHVDLVGVCDFSIEQAQKVAQSLKTQAYASAKDLIGKVDLVTIAASTQSHYDLAKIFIEAGIPVNVEKPLTATLEQSEKLLNLAEKKKVLVSVGHIERFNPAIRELQQHLGQVKHLSLKRLAPFKLRGADVSVLHDLMIHDIDLLTWLTGSQIVDVQGQGLRLVTKEWDAVTASFQLANGVTSTIEVSRVSPRAERSIHVIQSDALITAQTGSLVLEKSFAHFAQKDMPLQTTSWSVAKEDALQKETDAFIDSVLNSTRPVVTGWDGYQALRNIDWVDRVISQ